MRVHIHKLSPIVMNPVATKGSKCIKIYQTIILTP